MGEAAIKKIIEGSLKKVIEEIHCTKKELKNSIDSSKTRLLMKLEENNNKIKLLQSENQELKNKERLILLLTSFIKKREIFENKNKLKGTNYSISEDLTQSQREDYKNLKTQLINLKKSGKYNNCYIKGTHLILDGEKYTVEELTFIDGKAPNSAPPTPTLQGKFSPEQTVVPLVERSKETSKPTKFNKGTKTSKIAATNEKSDRTTRFGSTSSNR
ncbi:unnamed protein product [Psylliodes chrysocephalus]|uniref:Uncharacterized protein n=1 Tax=Psylliodes chrysocephalus TaxID=3402493 RepID=A0A9P0GB34_9CUCU|nr:unnamed protein product [Psylliodes chrysocephala]